MPHDRNNAKPRAGAGAKPRAGAGTKSAEPAAHRRPWDPAKDKLRVGSPEHIVLLRDHLVTQMGMNREIGRYANFLLDEHLKVPGVFKPSTLGTNEEAIAAYYASSTGLKCALQREEALGLMYNVIYDCLSDESRAAIAQDPTFAKLNVERNDPSALWRLIAQTHTVGPRMDVEGDAIAANNKVNRFRMAKDETLVMGRTRLDCLVKSAESIMERDLKRDFGLKEVIFLRSKGEADKALKATPVPGRMYTAPPFSEAVIASLFIAGLPPMYQELKNDVWNSSWMDATGKRVGSGPPTVQEAYNRAFSYHPPKYLGDIAGAYSTITKGDPSQLREGGNKGKGKSAPGKSDPDKSEKGKETPGAGWAKTKQSKYPCSICNAADHATHNCHHLEGVKKAVEKHVKSEGAAGGGPSKPFMGATQLDNPAMLADFDIREPSSVHDADCIPDTESVGSCHYLQARASDSEGKEMLILPQVHYVSSGSIILGMDSMSSINMCGPDMFDLLTDVKELRKPLSYDHATGNSGPMITHEGYWEGIHMLYGDKVTTNLLSEG